MTAIVDTPARDAPTGGLAARLLQNVAAHAGIALLGNAGCRAASTPHRDVPELVERMAAGLQSLGVQRGQRVALIADNSDTWLLTDLALLSLGAVDVPRGADASAEDVQFCIEHAGCTGVILGDLSLVAKLGACVTAMQFVVVLRGEAGPHIAFDAVLQRGQERLAQNAQCVARERAQVRDSDLATVIYTSGTTGNPKGVMLSHGNMLHNLRAVPAVLQLRKGERYLSFLPVWHSFERILDYVMLDCGLELHYGSRRTLREDFQRVRPQLVAAVPRVYETFVDAALNKLNSRKPVQRAVARALLTLSQRSQAWRRTLRGCAASPDGQIRRAGVLSWFALQSGVLLLAPARWLADRMIFSVVRKALGGEARLMISGGGALSPRVDEFLNNAGMTLLNGYGLTETSPVLSVRDPNRVLLGTTGPPLPQTQFRIVDPDGKELPAGTRGIVHARGPQVMQGYWKNPAATAAVLGADGWFNTGDLGILTACGALMITGRAKDTIVLSGGENVEPEPIEARLAASPFIADALVVGHTRKMLAALLIPNFSAVRKELGLVGSDAEIAAAEATRELLLRELKARTAGMRSFEQIGKVLLLGTAFSVEDGTLTGTLKKRRNVIEQRHAEPIARLFGAD